MADTYLSFMTTDLRYTSTDLRELLRISRFSQSMGSVGDSYDNALAESLLASLKKGARLPDFLQHRKRRRDQKYSIGFTGTTETEDKVR